jgi:transposase
MASNHNPKGRASKKEDREAQAERMWQDRANGLSDRQIAEKYEVSLRTVQNRFKEFPKEGIKELVVNRDPKVHMNEVAMIWEDRITNRLTMEQLAQKYNMTPDQIRKRMENYHPVRSDIIVEKQRLKEHDRLSMLEEVAVKIMTTDHYVVDKGQVVVDPYTGVPLVDDGPKMTAIDKILKIIEARRKLHGLDSPIKAEITHNSNVEIKEREVTDYVKEAIRRNEQRRLEQIHKTLGITEGDEEITDAEVLDETEDRE